MSRGSGINGIAASSRSVMNAWASVIIHGVGTLPSKSCISRVMTSGPPDQLRPASTRWSASISAAANDYDLGSFL